MHQGTFKDCDCHNKDDNNDDNNDNDDDDNDNNNNNDINWERIRESV